LYLFVLIGVVLWRRRQLTSDLEGLLGLGRNKRRRLSWHWPLLLLVFLGFGLQLPAVFSSGWLYDDGARFYFTNNQDGLMHLGFINGLTNVFPPIRPEINQPLTNYHYFTDLLLAQLGRFGLPTVHLFFQYFPILLSMLTTVLIYQVILWLTNRRLFAVGVTLVCLLAGDGGYLLVPFFPQSLGWEMATFDNGGDQFLNLPYATAKLIFFASWFFLNYFWRRKKVLSLVLAVVLGATLALFKIYFALFFLGGWALTLAWQSGQCWWQESAQGIGQKIKRCWQRLGKEALAFLCASGGSLVLLGQAQVLGSGGLIWSWLIWPKIISNGHLFWQRLSLWEQQWLPQWQAESKYWRLGLYAFLLTCVALIFIYGLRLLGLVVSKSARKMLGQKNLIFFLGSSVIWTFIGLNFVQSVGGMNSFNFFVIAAIALTIPLGLSVTSWWEGCWWQKILALLVIVLLAPRTLHNSFFHLRQSLNGEPANYKAYSPVQLELLQALAQRTSFNDLIGCGSSNQDLINASVIPGLAGRRTYLSNQSILSSHNVDFSERKTLLAQAWKIDEEEEFFRYWREELEVQYLYLETVDLEQATVADFTWEPLFQNAAGMIVQVK
jgi:hypothetical protein